MQPSDAFDRNLKKQHAKPTHHVGWLERLSFLGSWLLVCLALFVCGMGGMALFHKLKTAPIASVHVVGELSPFEKKFLLERLRPLVKKGYFQADLTTLRDSSKEVSWVDTVRVTRHWPNGILVRVTVKHPIARWGGVRLLNRDGTVFNESEEKNHNDLAQMYGPASQSVALMQLYQRVNEWFAPLGLRLKEIYFTDRLTCFMQFDNGLRIIVDQDRTMEKVQQLAQLSMGELKPAMPNLASIDLRYRNGFAVQWKAGARPKVVAGKMIYALS